MKNRMIGFGLALAVAFGLTASAEARVGGWTSGKLVFASEGNFSHDNSATASLFVASTLNRNQLGDGAVIVMEAFCTIGTVGDGATLTIGSSLGATDMLTAAVIMDAGRLYIRAVGTVRSLGTSGTILWSIACWPENTAAGDNNAAASFVFSSDTTADTVDWAINSQELGLSFDWTEADASNTLDVEQFLLWVY